MFYYSLKIIHKLIYFTDAVKEEVDICHVKIIFNFYLQPRYVINKDHNPVSSMDHTDDKPVISVDLTQINSVDLTQVK